MKPQQGATGAEEIAVFRDGSLRLWKMMIQFFTTGLEDNGKIWEATGYMTLSNHEYYLIGGLEHEWIMTFQTFH